MKHIRCSEWILSLVGSTRRIGCLAMAFLVSGSFAFAEPDHPAAYLDEDTVIAVEIHVDSLAASLQRWIALLDETAADDDEVRLRQGSRSLRKRIARWEWYTEFDLEEDLLSLLTGDIAVGLHIDDWMPLQGDAPQDITETVFAGATVFAIESARPQRALDRIADALEKTGLDIAYHQDDVLTVPLPTGALWESVALRVDGDYLLAARTPQNLEEAVLRAHTRRPNLERSTSFHEVRSMFVVDPTNFIFVNVPLIQQRLHQLDLSPEAMATRLPSQRLFLLEAGVLEGTSATEGIGIAYQETGPGVVYSAYVPRSLTARSEIVHDPASGGLLGQWASIAFFNALDVVAKDRAERTVETAKAALASMGGDGCTRPQAPGRGEFVPVDDWLRDGSCPSDDVSREDAWGRPLLVTGEGPVYIVSMGPNGELDWDGLPAPSGTGEEELGFVYGDDFIVHQDDGVLSR